jgi:hypothetical protein
MHNKPILECTNTLILELTRTTKTRLKHMGMGAVGGAIGAGLTGAAIGTAVGGPLGTPIGFGIGVAKGMAAGAASSYAEDTLKHHLIKRRRKQARLARIAKKNPEELPKSTKERRRYRR